MDEELLAKIALDRPATYSANVPAVWYIDPNQFAYIDDEVSEKAGRDPEVDKHLESRAEAVAVALRLAKSVQYHVEVDVWANTGPDRYETIDTIYVYPSGNVVG